MNCTRLLALSILQVISISAFASGFQLNETSPSIQGSATAGAAAANDDVSSMFNNPATLSTLKHNQAYVGTSWIYPQVKMTDATATHTVNIPGNPNSSISAPVLGTTSRGNVGSRAIVPDGHFSWRFNDMVVAGLSMTGPFGLTTLYDRSSVVRFASQEAALRTFNINPAVSVKLNERWAIGLGFLAQYAHASLSNFNGTYTGDPETDQLLAANFPTRLTVDGWGYGYNLGVLYKPCEGTRLGVGYRSRIVQDLQGEGRQYVMPGPTVPAPSQSFLFNASTSVNASLQIPAVLNLSAAQDIQNWTLKASAQLTFWDDFTHLSVNMPEAFGTNTTIQAKWTNSWLFAVGADYRLTNMWTLRGGVAYDQTPTRDGFRDPRIPDSERYWTAVGLTFTPCKNLSFDGVYEHIFGKNGKVNVVQASGSSITSTRPLEENRVNARYKSSVDIVGIALRYSFC